MYIYKMLIRNFRGIKDLEFFPNKNINILIGHNNVGKTSILEAINLVLDPYYPWYIQNKINKYDFYNGDTRNSIEIELWLSCGKSLCKTCEKRIVKVGSEKEYLCPFMKYINFYDNERREFLKSNHSKEKISKSLKILRVKLIISYDHEEEEIVEPEFLILDSNGNAIENFRRYHKKWIGYKFVRSNRDYDKELKFNKNSLLSKVIDIEKIRKDTWSRIKENEVIDILKKSNDLQGIIKYFNENIKVFNGEKIETDIIFAETGPFSILNLLQLAFGSEAVGAIKLPLLRHGDGFNNMVLMNLIADYIQNNTSTNKIIAIEEPEQNLEPFNQRWLSKKICNLVNDNVNNQLFMTTHSVNILQGLNNLDYLQICKYKGKGKLEFVELDTVNKMEIVKSRHTSTEFLSSLFGRGVFVVEGECEFGAIPIFLNKLYRTQEKKFDLDLVGFEIINGGGTDINKVIKLYKKLGMPIIVLLDYDKEDSEKEFKKYKKFSNYIIALPRGWEYEYIIANSIEKLCVKKQCKILRDIFYEYILKKKRIGGDLAKLITSMDDFHEETLEHHTINMEILDKYFDKKQEKFNSKDISIILANMKSKYIAQVTALCMTDENIVPSQFVGLYNLLYAIFFNNLEEGIYILNEKDGYNSYVEGDKCE